MNINDVWLVIIGAVLGAVLSFLASIGMVIIQRLLDRKGKLSIFYKMVHSKFSEEPSGFYRRGAYSVILSLPMYFELQNTANTTRVIRDVCVLLYQDGKIVDKTIQAQRAVINTRSGGEDTGKEEINYGSDKGSYSFVLPPRSIQRQECEFLLKVQDAEVKSKAFDELKIRYYDERNKEHIFPLRKIDKCWEPRSFETDKEWVLLNRK